MKKIFWYFLALLLFSCTIANAQGLYMAKQVGHKRYMRVEIVDIDQVKHVYDSIQVLWATDVSDKTCFVFDSRQYCFQELTSASRKRNTERIEFYKKFVLERYTETNRIFLREDTQHHELYVLRFVLKQNYSLEVYITNVEYGFPTYMLTSK